MWATECEASKVIRCADGNFLATSGIQGLPCGAWGATEAEARQAWRVTYRRLGELVVL